MRKSILLCSMMAAGILSIASCNDVNDDFDDKGSCTIQSFTGQESAYMGDSIAFNFQVASGGVRLNMARVQLLFGDKVVSERFVTVGDNGSYSGKVLVPFLANIPDGTAKVVLTAQNERFAKDRKELDIQINRPKDLNVLFISSEGTTYPMTVNPSNPYEYTLTDASVPIDVEGYIKIEKYGTNGNAMTFGNENGFVTKDATNDIEFMLDPSSHKIIFNSLTCEVSPIVKFALNGEEFKNSSIDNEYYVDMDMEQNGSVVISGMKKEWSQYWIDPSWFNYKKNTDKKELIFKAISGKYRFSVNKGLKYIKVEVMDGDAMASLQDDGTGTIWVSGNNNIGKPNITTNNINWKPAQMFCLAPIEKNKYEFIFEGGKQLGSNLNFKFYYDNTQNDKVDGILRAFNNENPLTATNPAKSFITVNGSDGNIKQNPSKFTAGSLYRLTITVSETNKQGTLDIQELNETLPKEVD